MACSTCDVTLTSHVDDRPGKDDVTSGRLMRKKTWHPLRPAGERGHLRPTSARGLQSLNIAHPSNGQNMDLEVKILKRPTIRGHSPLNEMGEG